MTTKNYAEGNKRESTVDRQNFWLNHYAENGTGMCVECSLCFKWRKVIDYYEDKEVPPNWHCGMAYLITNKKRADCSISSIWDESLSRIESQRYPGEIVWVKHSAYPWWPAMVEDDPDIEEYTKEDPSEKVHVTFFAKEVSRSWILAKNVVSYEVYRNNTKELNISPRYSENFKFSIEKAEEAFKMKLQDRLKKFSFAKCYKGKRTSANPSAVALEGVKREPSVERLKKKYPDQFWISDPKIKRIWCKPNSGDKANSSGSEDKNGMANQMNKLQKRIEYENRRLELYKANEEKKVIQEKHYKVEVDETHKHSYSASSETSDNEGSTSCLLQRSGQFNGQQKMKKKVLSKKRQIESSDEEIVVKKCHLKDLDASSPSNVSCSSKQPDDANKYIVSSDEVKSALKSVKSKNLQPVPKEEGQFSRESSMSPIYLSPSHSSSPESDLEASPWSRKEEIIPSPPLSYYHESSSKSDEESFIRTDPNNTIMDENALR